MSEQTVDEHFQNTLDHWLERLDGLTPDPWDGVISTCHVRYLGPPRPDLKLDHGAYIASTHAGEDAVFIGDARQLVPWMAKQLAHYKAELEMGLQVLGIEREAHNDRKRRVTELEGQLEAAGMRWPQTVATLEKALESFPAGRIWLAQWTKAENDKAEAIAKLAALKEDNEGLRGSGEAYRKAIDEWGEAVEARSVLIGKLDKELEYLEGDLLTLRGRGRRDGITVDDVDRLLESIRKARRGEF